MSYFFSIKKTECVARVIVESSNWLREKTEHNRAGKKSDMTMGFLLSFPSQRYSSFLVSADVFWCVVVNSFFYTYSNESVFSFTLT